MRWFLIHDLKYSQNYGLKLQQFPLKIMVHMWGPKLSPQAVHGEYLVCKLDMVMAILRFRERWMVTNDTKVKVS